LLALTMIRRDIILGNKKPSKPDNSRVSVLRETG
jgi:hypothetical protein